MTLSAYTFRRAYHRFLILHIERCRVPFDSFSDAAFAQFQEGYKNAIPERALAIMQPQRWTRSAIGTGEILADVINAIELKGNNLLQWEGRNGPSSRVHRPLLEAVNEPTACAALEQIFYDLYKEGHANRRIFEGLIERCGRRYELLGYLFFIAAPDRFLPLRTRSFDRAFEELGANLKTEGKCGWENYLSFLSVIREVRRCLHAEGISEVTLLDAHSFCWILARNPRDEAEPVSPRAVSIEDFTGALIPGEGRKFTPNDEASVRDMFEEALRRQASGRMAEEIALEAEKERLLSEGREDLATRVEDVSNRPGLGYDIKSFEADGSERLIEVKNVSNGSPFFLSEGEWLNSQARPNYWFYLVNAADDMRSLSIQRLSAKALKQSHLQPVQYLVRFDP